jgi:transcriptional regulator with XRE-family HTH domain
MVMSLGDTIKRLRLERNWTQHDLAEHAGMRQGHVAEIG